MAHCGVEHCLKSSILLIAICTFVQINCDPTAAPSLPPQASALTSITTSLNNATIVQAYPAITALKGSQVAIPCNISHQQQSHTSPLSPLNGTTSTTFSHSQFAHSSTSDDANLILWYRGDDISGAPIYTVDGRDISSKSWPSATGNDSSQSLRHFVGPELTGRARVNLANRPAVLIIDAIDATDSGTYWCRVDFRWTRTLISMVQLNVHVPSESVNIWAVTSESPKAVQVQVPNKPSPAIPWGSRNIKFQSYFASSNSAATKSSASKSPVNASLLLISANEGAHVQLFCEAFGGNPPPSVIWLDSANRILDASFHILNVTSLEEVKYHYEKFVFAQADPTVESSGNQWSKGLSAEWSAAHVNQKSAVSNQRTPISVVINSMSLYRLDRQSAGATLSCVVNNSDMAPSIRQSVQIDLNLNPSHVTIMPPIGSYLSDGLKTEVNCRAYGGKPYSLISWFLDGQNVTNLSDYDFEVNFTTSSVLKFTPNWRQDQRTLICLAYNPTIVGAVNVSQSLDVPQIKLITREAAYLPTADYFAPNFTEFNKVLQNSDANQLTYIHVEEGGNVTLDCIIIAKPKVTVVRWTHNLAEIWHETEGIVAENQSLSIINAKRGQHEGIFRCIAFNSEGRGVSNEIRIIVDYAPQCSATADSSTIDASGRSIYYAKIGQTVNITCQLDARPAHNVTFYWTLNNQISDRLYIQPGSGIGADRMSTGSASPSQVASQQINWHQTSSAQPFALLQSVASLLPRTAADFGIVRCWARNPIGYQAKPCMFFLNQLPSSPVDAQHSSPASAVDSARNWIDTSRSGSPPSNASTGNLAGETSLIGTSSSATSPGSPQSLSPSSYSSMLSRASSSSSSTQSGPVDTGNANSHSKQLRVKQQPPLDGRQSPGQNNQQPPPQQHRLLNHLCHLNRTLSSIALNCSLIENSSLSREILALAKEQPSSSGDGSSKEPPLSASLLPPFVIVTYLVELYDNRDNLLSGKILNDTSAGGLHPPATSHSSAPSAYQFNLLYIANNLTSNTWYKLKLKTFLRHTNDGESKRKRRWTDDEEKRPDFDFDLPPWTDTVENSQSATTKSRKSPLADSNLATIGRQLANGDNSQSDNGNYMAADPVMEANTAMAAAAPGTAVAAAAATPSAPSRQMVSNGAHSAVQQHTDHSALFYFSNGTFQNLRIDPLLWQAAPSAPSPSSPMYLPQLTWLFNPKQPENNNKKRNDSNGHRQGRRGRGADFGHSGGAHYQEYDENAETEDDANEAEMHLFTTADNTRQSLSASFPGHNELQMTGHLRTATETVRGVMSQIELRLFRQQLKQLRRHWKLYSSELIRFRTLSRDPVIGYHNDDYDEADSAAVERIPGPPPPNSDIVPKSLTDQTILRPVFILLNIGSWVMLALCVVFVLAFVCYRLRSTAPLSSDVASSTTSPGASKKSQAAKSSQASGNQLEENMAGRHNLEESSILYETHNGLNGGGGGSSSKLQLFTDHEQSKLVSQNYTETVPMNTIAGGESMPLDLIGQSTGGFTILRSRGPFAAGRQQQSSTASPHHHQQQAMLQQLLMEQSAAIAARAHNNSSNNSSYSTMTTSSSILGSAGGSSSSGATTAVAAAGNSSGKLLRYAGHDATGQLADIVELTGNTALEPISPNSSGPLMLNLMMMGVNGEHGALALQQFSPQIQLYEQSTPQNLLINQADCNMLLMEQGQFTGADSLASLHVKLCDTQLESSVDESNGNFTVLNFVHHQQQQHSTPADAKLTDASSTQTDNSQQSDDNGKPTEQMFTSYSTRV